MRTPFYRREEVEALAAAVHRRLAAVHGGPIPLPVDVDAAMERVLGLSCLYEPIPEPPGTTILAALHPEQRLIILNERHVDEFGRNEGLERFTKAHELGHWVCHVAQGRGQLVTGRHLADAAALVAFPGEPAAGVWHLATPPERDRQERHANWFAAALLMPRTPLLRAAARVDITCWRGRYELRDRFGVSISALNARLAQLGFPGVE
jgi:hypothetical protein